MIITHQGLSNEDVRNKKSLNLQNSTIDTYSPGFTRIIIRNTFTAMTVAFIPIIFALFLFEIYREAFALTFFVVFSAIFNIGEEFRIKRRLNKLKKEFQNTARILRNGETSILPVEEIVLNDLIVAKEGDSIIADGRIIQSEYLQIDESSLTGESDYISKNNGDELLSGSFVVTGEVLYEVTNIGADNYMNKLSHNSGNYQSQKSKLEKIGSQVMYIFALSTLLIGTVYFVATSGVSRIPSDEVLLSITTIVAAGIPQTLLILFILTYIVSITRLANKGIVIQKRGAIDALADIDIICIDKTGTITTNEMIIHGDIFKNIEKDKVGDLFNSVSGRLYGQNKTLKTVLDFFKGDENPDELMNFDQIPFNSKIKYSAFEINNKSIILGAYSQIKKFVKKDEVRTVDTWVESEENRGRRVVLGIVFDENIIQNLRDERFDGQSNKYFLLSIQEGLNPGIKGVLNKVKKQNILIKIISGDSSQSVARIAEKIGIQTENIFEVGKDELTFEAVMRNDIFTRATPESKKQIIEMLQKQGNQVAMIGDGINDVMGLKQADVAISMESGAKITKDISDIVLLNNDYHKIPDIFYEGDNIVFNLKLSTKIFFARTVMIGVIALFFALIKKQIPIFPTSTLIFTFLGSTVATYFVAFSRQNIKDQNNKHFIKESITHSFLPGVFMGIMTIVLYSILKTSLSEEVLNTALVISILGMSTAYMISILWEDGKLNRNLAFAIGIFITSFVFGNWMIITPYSSIENDLLQELYLISTLTFCALLFLGLMLFGGMKNSKKLIQLGFILPSIVLVSMFFLPARAYFAISPVNLKYFPVIVSTMSVGIILVLISGRISRVIGKRM
jgi:cation-transporting ATPase E